MGYPISNWSQLSDLEILREIGSFLKSVRVKQNKTQAQLAEMAGLNRWTISQLEKGEAISLSSLIPILRSLDSLHLLSEFSLEEEISPLEYAKLKKPQRQRARPKNYGSSSLNEDPPEW